METARQDTAVPETEPELIPIKVVLLGFLGLPVLTIMVVTVVSYCLVYDLIVIGILPRFRGRAQELYGYASSAGGESKPARWKRKIKCWLAHRSHWEHNICQKCATDWW
jgi:hypothetical protein